MAPCECGTARLGRYVACCMNHCVVRGRSETMERVAEDGSKVRTYDGSHGLAGPVAGQLGLAVRCDPEFVVRCDLELAVRCDPEFEVRCDPELAVR